MKRLAVIVCGGLLFGVAGIAHGADNFQCYRIRQRQTSPKFVRASATTMDSFNPIQTSTEFKRPFLLCDSASFNGSAIADSAARLSCYRTRKGPDGTQVVHSVTDGWGTRNETTRKKSRIFCLSATSTP